MIFNIADIFNASDTEGALAQNNATRYYIAPYQRGFKWGAALPNDPVCLLMKDLTDAAENNMDEYYLQFITVKTLDKEGARLLEVIDGQQRLTTLTILLSILAYRNGKMGTAISNHKLSYEVRPKVTDFFNDYIYNHINTLLEKDWQTFITTYPDQNEQDIYYLFNAAKKIDELLTRIELPKQQLEEYILDKVKIILNNVERNISCEEVFSNLNGNKVELTAGELVKGLFLTKSARDKEKKNNINYKEILEIRAVMGRQWDAIAHWANRDDINNFFFNGSENVMDDLLKLLAIRDGFDEKSAAGDKYAIFNFFQTQIKKEARSANQYFFELKELKQILNDWFNDPEVHKLLGFLRFAKDEKKRFNITEMLNDLQYSKTEVKKKLKEKVLKVLPNDIKDLEYGRESGNESLHNVLFALSVFTDATRFDFLGFAHKGKKDTWSLEHIFPQKPEDLPDVLYTGDIDLINDLTKDKLADQEKVRHILNEFFPDDSNRDEILNTLSLKLTQKECSLDENEKKLLSGLIRGEKLNSIGNMALLLSTDNSSNSNGMFDKKRNNIVRRISNGSFVPRHTYDVFSKLLSDKMSPSLRSWTEKDIDAHEAWIEKRISDIKSKLQWNQNRLN